MNDGFSTDIETRVHNHRAPRQFMESFDNPVISAVPVLIHGLHSGRIIDMSNRRVLRSWYRHPDPQVGILHFLFFFLGEFRTDLIPDRCHKQHIRTFLSTRQIEPLAGMLRQHGSFEVRKMSWTDSARRCLEVY
jgi:hypothetical protein